MIKGYVYTKSWLSFAILSSSCGPLCDSILFAAGVALKFVGFEHFDGVI